MKNLLLAVIISMTMAMLSASSINLSYRRQIPIIYELEELPIYGRKRPLKMHYQNRFI